MESTHRPPHPTLRPRWLLAVGSVITAAVFLVALLRRIRSPQVAQQSLTIASHAALSSTTEPSLSVAETTNTQKIRASSRGWIVLLLAVLIAAVGLTLLQNAAPEVSGLLFAAMVGVSLVLAVRLSSVVVRRRTEAFLAGRGGIYLARIRSIWRGISALVDLLRGLLTVLTASAALAVLVMSAVSFQGAHLRTSQLDDAFGLMLIGCAMMVIPIFLSRKTVSLPGITWLKSRAVPEHINVLLLVVGIGLLTVVSLENAYIPPNGGSNDMTTNTQFALLCGGILLVVIGLGGKRFLPRFRQVFVYFLRQPITKTSNLAVPPQSSTFRLQQFLPVAIVLLAFGLRLWHVDDAYRFFIDELNHISAIYDLVNDPYTALLRPFSGIAAFPYIFPYGQRIALDIFGHNYLGLRVFSVVIGTLAVAAVYRLGRALFDRPTALIAALLLATFPPHLQFSREGLNNIADPFFGTLALAFLASGLCYNRRMDWVLGGVMLGLTHYFYEAGRLLFTPLVIVWLIGVWLLVRFQRRADKHDEARPVLTRFPINWHVAGVALVLVAAPVYITLIGINRPLTARLVDNQTGLAGDYWSALFRYGDYQNHIEAHVVPAFAAYLSEPDNTLFYGGATALLLVAVAPFFMLGLAFLLWRWRSPGAILLLLWVFSAALGNTMMVQSTGYARFVVVFPALILVTAVGIRYGLHLLLLRGGRQRWKWGIIVVLTVALALFQTYYYFAIHIHDLNTQSRNGWGHPDAEDAILRSISFPPGTHLHFVSAVEVNRPYNVGVLGFFRPDLSLDSLKPEDLTADYFRHLPCDTNHAFFLAPDDLESLRRIRQAFYLRQAVMSPYKDIPPDEQFALYFAPYWPGNARPFGLYRCSP